MNRRALSTRMASVGIVQLGAPILHRKATPFQLPSEADSARRLLADLCSAIERGRCVYAAPRVIGLAAPQIGVARAAAVILISRRESVALLNPVVLHESAETDEQYEGCWSLFDFRGSVRRSLSIDVENANPDGVRQFIRFDGASARLVAHEVDHLNGRLYTGRLSPNVGIVPAIPWAEHSHP